MKQDQSTQLPMIVGQEHTATCIAAIFPTPNLQYLLTQAQVANYSRQILSIEKKKKGTATIRCVNTKIAATNFYTYARLYTKPT